MKTIEDIDALEALYGDASPGAVDKVARHLTPLYRRWIGASRFAILSTAGPEGTDCSPRGDDGPVVRAADETTLMLPDRRGNQPAGQPAYARRRRAGSTGKPVTRAIRPMRRAGWVGGAERAAPSFAVSLPCGAPAEATAPRGRGWRGRASGGG